MPMMTRRNNTGFTLIELLITVAIIAILGTIALPAYYSFVLESRRADAHATLSKIQLAQENFRGSCKEYASSFGGADDCSTYALKWGYYDAADNPVSRDGHYKIDITSADGNSYTLKAEAVGDQADDSQCKEIFLIVNSTNPNGDKTSSPSGPEECWNE
jgi:type IV pilus assembly protein PilE